MSDHFIKILWKYFKFTNQLFWGGFYWFFSLEVFTKKKKNRQNKTIQSNIPREKCLTSKYCVFYSNTKLYPQMSNFNVTWPKELMAADHLVIGRENTPIWFFFFFFFFFLLSFFKTKLPRRVAHSEVCIKLVQPNLIGRF